MLDKLAEKGDGAARGARWAHKAVPTGWNMERSLWLSGGQGSQRNELRRDVGTDGRRAVVRFSDSIIETRWRRRFPQ